MNYKQRIIFKTYIIKKNRIYIYDGKNITFDLEHFELECAKWMIENFGDKIYLIPKVNVPIRIKTADYLYKNEYWDLKTIYSNGKRTIDNQLKKSRDQASNFIIDISHSKMDVSDAIYQVLKIFNDPKRNWINTVILKNMSEIIFIFTKKEMPPNQITVEDHFFIYYI